MDVSINLMEPRIGFGIRDRSMYQKWKTKWKAVEFEPVKQTAGESSPNPGLMPPGAFLNEANPVVSEIVEIFIGTSRITHWAV